MYIIENSHIGLKRTLPEEIELIFEMEKQGENVKFVKPYDRKRHIEVVENVDEEHLTIWQKRPAKLVGFIILAGIQNPDLSLEFRRIVVQEKGKGIGRQCLQLVKSYCFNELKFHRLWLDVYEDNIRAIHLYKSEGFKEEGKLRELRKQDGKDRSLLVLSIKGNESNPGEIPV